MGTKLAISLTIPWLDRSDRYFSFHLKQQMQEEQIEYHSAKQVLIVSGVISSFRDFCKLLFRNGVIDKNLKWSYGEGHIVIMANFMQKNDQLADCLWLIYSLEEQAYNNGGHIHYITGRQKCFNFDKDWRYVHPKYAVKKPGTKNPTAALYYGNTELWHWLCGKNCIERIGTILVLHSSILQEINILSYTLPEINLIARMPTKEFWTNSDVKINTTFNKEDQVNDLLLKFGVQTVVTDCTAGNEICNYFNGKLISMGTDSANEKSNVLLVRRNHFYSVNGSKERKRIK